MTKSQLEIVCRKIKCSKGTKKEMIVNLLRPFTTKKYRMDSDDDDTYYIYPSSEEDYSDFELSDSDDENEEEIEQPKIFKKTGLNLEKIPKKYNDQLNDLLTCSLNADKTRKKPPYSREELEVFVNDLKMIKNRHIIEDAYNRFKKYMNDWRTQGGYPVDPELFISNATDDYNQKRKRSREIIKRSLGKYHKKRQKSKQEEERRIKPTSAEERRKLFLKRFDKKEQPFIKKYKMEQWEQDGKFLPENVVNKIQTY